MAQPPRQLHRTFALKVRSADLDPADADGDEAYDVSLSSEEPVPRWFGLEVLDHSPDAVDLSRARDGLPLLSGHNDSALPIGRLDAVRTDGERLRARMRFFDTPGGREARAVVQGGHRELSVGYAIQDYVVEQGRDGGPDTYTATRWTPFEGSLVAVPADHTIGVGRSAGRAPPRGNFAMPDDNTTSRSERRSARETADLELRASESARDMAAQVAATANRYGLGHMVPEWLSRGLTRQQIHEEILERVSTRPHRMPAAEELDREARESVRDRHRELIPAEELRRYSLTRAILAALPDADNRAKRAAGFELECSRAIADQSGREVRGVMVPDGVLFPTRPRGLRAMTVGTAADGGDLVATNLLASEYIEALANEAQVVALGARQMTGLVGNVTVPRETAGLTVAWQPENTNAGDTQPTFDLPSLTPHDVSATVEISRRLLQQSTPSADALVRSDLARYLNIAVDAAAVNGAGSGNEPLGILNASISPAASLGSTGGAPTWAAVVACIGALATGNALRGSLGFLTNGNVMAKMLATPKIGSTFPNFQWDSGPSPLEGRIAGFPARVSNNVPSNLSKSSSGSILSALIFGNWSELIIGVWGGVDLIADPYTLSKKGSLQLTAWRTVDVLIRHEASFTFLNDVNTT